MPPVVVSERTLHRTSVAAAFFALTAGCVVLVGWAVGDDKIKEVVPFPNEVTIKTNTALAFALAAASLLLWRRGRPGLIASRVCAVGVIAIGAATLCEHVFGVSLGVDQLIFHEPARVIHTSSPNRMAANTAFCDVVLGLALVLIDRRLGSRRPSNGLVLIVALVAALALVGIVMNVTAIPGVSQDARMALVTAITFIVLAIGCFCADPSSAAIGRVFAVGPGGMAIRRLLPVAAGLPIALGALRLAGLDAGLFGAEVGTWLLIVAVIVCVGGLVWRLSGSLDRTDEERRQAERQLREAVAEAERASKAKSEFLSRMSHELRTPLNAILGFGQLLELDELREEQRESVEHIIGAGRHLLGLINEVLDIARIESGKLTLSVEPVEFVPILEEAASLIGPLAMEKQISVALDAGVAEPLRLLADRQRLKQIILNLLSNAVKYNHAEGWVRVHCERRAQDVLAIVVADGGPGIDPADQQRMFDPFERVGEQTGEGTGLGLALSRRLAELMNGSLEVESEPGRGSQFTLTLKSSTQLAQLDPTGRSTGGAIESRPDLSGSILYVEDNPANVALVESFCARFEGLRLRTASNGRDGLDAVRSEVPDLVLLDLHLPDMHGSEVLARLRTDPRSAAVPVPVLVLTADATSGQGRKLRGAGADGYLTKPLDMPLFEAEVVRLLGTARVPEAAGDVPSPPSFASDPQAPVHPH